MKVNTKQERSRVRTVEDLMRRYDLDAIVFLKQASKNNEEGLNKVNAELEGFVNATLATLADMQNQIDGNITTYFYKGVPSMENVPASEWTTDELKKAHLGDLYYDQDTGYAYRFALNGEVYEWSKIVDNDVVEALALANAAQDTADGKRRVFTDTPSPPYDKGDLWIKDKEIYICLYSRADGKFESGDFGVATKYTDDTRANEVAADLAKNYSTTVEMNTAIETSKNGILAAVSATYTTKDALTEEITAVEKQIASVDVKADGISTRVSEQESNITGLTTRVSATETSHAQLSDKFEWIVSGTSKTNFTLTSEMAKLVTESLVITDSTGTSTIISGGKMNINEIFAQDITATGTITGATLEGATIKTTGASSSYWTEISNGIIESHGEYGYTILDNAYLTSYAWDTHPTITLYYQTSESSAVSKVTTIGATGASFGGSVSVSGSITASDEIISTNADTFRSIYGNYGAFWRNDGASLYLMFTNSGDPYGTWNDLRPLSFDLTYGHAYFGHSIVVLGRITAYGGLALGTGTENPNMPYFLGIDSFAEGGAVRWIYAHSVADAIGALKTSGGVVSGTLIMANDYSYAVYTTSGTPYSAARMNTSNRLQYGYGSPRTQIFSNSRIDFFCNGMTSTSETGMSFAYDAPNYNFRPTLNDTVNLGSSAYKWKCVYAVNGTIQTSDRRYKRDINALDERYEVLSQLICAKSFIMDIVDERRRIGYIAQELEALVRSVGLSVDECSFINKDWIERKDYTGWEYSLDYTQINTMRIESIQKQINELKVEIATLKAAN